MTARLGLLALAIALAIAPAIGCKGDEPPAKRTRGAGSGTGDVVAIDARPLTGFNPLAIPDAATAPSKGSPAAPAPESASTLALTPLSASDASAFDYKGDTLEQASAFRDTRGDNVVLVSSSSSTSTRAGSPTTTRKLWILHLRTDGPGAPPVVVREMKDLVEACPFDATLAVVDGPVLTDLDGDGVGELTVTYRLGCRSDVSPLTVKVLMIEDGEKYAVRGETRISGANGANGANGTNGTLDPARPPAAFRAHLLSRFERFSLE
jgi:hypothetical protein